MIQYIGRRLLLLPLTLFAIVLVNFVILNLAPGDPVNMAGAGSMGEAMRNVSDANQGGDNQYLLFREHYGLTLPVLFNYWPSLSKEVVYNGITKLSKKEEMGVHEYHKLRTLWGDRAQFVLSSLLEIASNPHEEKVIRMIAANLFIRGNTHSGHAGVSISESERTENKHIAKTNLFLSKLSIQETDTIEEVNEKIIALNDWFKESGKEAFKWTKQEKIRTFFFTTRFARYLSRVAALDFGSLRNDSNKTVIREVAKRLKYSIALALFPMLITFCLCQVFGMIMAVCQGRWPDYSLNVIFLILFAIPIFVVGPFLIEKIALHKTFPFSSAPIPYSGFHSSQNIYENFTSRERLFDITRHLMLPLVAIIYGTLAVQSRISRTAFLEVLRQDYIRTARAKGLKQLRIFVKHVGRCGSITIITSLAASLGVILGGSLIVETIFEINGFGRFFYEAILNRDYNVVLFSAFAGSFLTLVGFLIADIAYTVLDPRVNLK